MTELNIEKLVKMYFRKVREKVGRYSSPYEGMNAESTGAILGVKRVWYGRNWSEWESED